MQKKLISILLCAMLFCCSGCQAEQRSPEQPAIPDSAPATEDKKENDNNEVQSDEKDISNNTTYAIDEKEPLNTDYHIRNEATKITHLESLFDKLNELS